MLWLHALLATPQFQVSPDGVLRESAPVEAPIPQFVVEMNAFEFERGTRPSRFVATRIISRATFDAYSLQPTPWDQYNARMRQLGGRPVSTMRLNTQLAQPQPLGPRTHDTRRFVETRVTPTAEQPWLYMREFSATFVGQTEVGRETIWEITLPVRPNELVVILPRAIGNREPILLARVMPGTASDVSAPGQPVTGKKSGGPSNRLPRGKRK